MRPIAYILWTGLLLLLGSEGVYAVGPVEEGPFAKAKVLIDRGENRKAIELLKESLSAEWTSGPQTRLMASAYLADGNEIWALRALHRQTASVVDPETQTWIAWIHLQNGRLDRAEEALEAVEEAVPDPLSARTHLLRAMLYHARERDPQALAELEWVRSRAGEMFAEDRSLMDHLERSVDPGHISPLSFSVSLSGGRESNVAQSSILESDRKVGSYVVEFDQDGRFVMAARQMFRPVLEYRIKLKGYPGGQDDSGEIEAWDLSYADISGRIGVILGKGIPRGSLYYSNVNVLLAGDDGVDADQQAYAVTHRGEFEIEIPGGILVFGGGGQKTFREAARSRNEGDLGLAVMKGLTDRVSLTGILSGRLFDSRSDAYDLRGGSALAFLRVPLLRDGFARLGFTLLFDDYHASERSAYWGGEQRQDRLVRAKVVLWGPSRMGFRVGLSYQYTNRDSTVDAFAYENHEVLVRILWRGEFDPWRPSLIRPRHHVAVDYGLDRAYLPEERIQDLLRQEDAARRSQQCME